MWGVKPSEFFELDPRDQSLMEGYALLEQSIRGHGYPSWVAEDPENMGRFEIKERQDFAAEALESWRENAPKKPSPGMRQYVEFKAPPPVDPDAA